MDNAANAVFDVKQIRNDFPILGREVHGRPLVYLDNGATMQMPEPVLEAVEEQYRRFQSNIHRGVHYLSEESTARVESVRKKTARFIGAGEPEEVIFTAGTTAAVNLVARAFSDGVLSEKDSVVTTQMEHHSNLIPWQQACRRSGARLDVVRLTDSAELDMDELARYIDRSPKLLAVTMVSNVTGTVNPIREITDMAHRAGTAVLVDCAQAMRHSGIDVKELDCDFICFSGHKMMAPTGVGVLYGKRGWLERLPPTAFGGGMVDEVSCTEATFAELPFRHEAGTANIAGIIGLGAAIDYMERLGLEKIYRREDMLIKYLRKTLASKDNTAVLGEPARYAGAVSFNISGMHPFDSAKLLDRLGIAVRSGHHCAQPLLERFGLDGAVRATPAFYNTREEIDALAEGIDRVAALVKRE